MIDELFEYGVYLALLVALAIPLSAYLNKVMAGQKTVLSRVLVPVENAVYRCIRVDKSEDMGWKRYLVSAFAFSVICLVGLFAILMLQGLLPLTPAVGLGVLFALFRGIVSEGNPGLGNFWVDVTRAVLFVLIPLSLVVTMIDVQQGSPQNFNEYETVQLLEPVGVTADGSIVDADDPAAVETIDQATVPMGPQASQVAIKQLGTNGGGYNGVNSASALENPTPLTNLVQCLSLLLIPVACVFSFGRFVMDRRQGRAVFAAMFILLVGALVAIAVFEQMGTPQLAADGQVYMGASGQSGGNMEGKETRFGVTDSSLWAAFTTAASNGSVNAMHDSFTPIGGMVPIVLMALGEVVFGGVGCGLYGMLGFVILTVFIAGLMVGRTPEYLGKKIGPKEMRMAVILCITTPLLILVGAGIMSLDPATANSLNNPGVHGFSEVLYAATSAGGNNGSAFAGFNGNTPLINLVLGFEMLANRFIPIAAVCVLAGSLAVRPKVATSAGTLSTSNALFVFLLVLMVLLIGALTMFPALALGPVAEQLMMVL